MLPMAWLGRLRIAEINRIFWVNTLGPIRTAKAVIPSMRARRSGTIINISSSTVINALPGIGAYAATKYALEGPWPPMASHTLCL
ncbi:hypothetical protein PG997_012976 [Apiospora hydei]|uniref:Uncharacterized protein n=1 Tax=Apiospora hydei TaxID=1337664 RepID=A0ABR1V838_9PEZI